MRNYYFYLFLFIFMAKGGCLSFVYVTIYYNV